jgi:hypothetical protein
MDRTWLLFTAAAFARDKRIRREVERLIDWRRERERDERALRGDEPREEVSSCSCHPPH